MNDAAIRVSHYSLARRCNRTSSRHAFAVINFQLTGEASVEQHETVALQTGDVQLIPVGAAHRIVSARGAEWWSAAIHPSRLDRDRFGPLLAPLEQVSRGALPRLSIPAGRRDFVTTLFSELSTLEGRDEAVRAESLIALLLSELKDHAPAPATTRAHSDLTTAALSFIAAHAFGPLTLADVARGLGRDRSHLAEVLRRESGRSVGEWIAEVRLEEARRRLESTTERIDVIAERVGYADGTHFARLFKRRYGTTPRAWRLGAAAGAQREVLGAARAG
jgi:AraC family transcriptional regulator, transcriptional activator of pobA